jgi:hypothetical protein
MVLEIHHLPYALERKYKHAARDWRWQNIFPARDLSIDPRTGLRRRHHRDEATINKAIKAAADTGNLDAGFVAPFAAVSVFTQ